MAFMCAAFSACGVDLAASAGGISLDNASEEQADLEEHVEEGYDESAEEEASDEIDDESTADIDEETYEVILNSNPERMRYHLPGCRGVGQISEEHYQEYKLTKEEIKDKEQNDGWIPCGWCHPERKLGIDQ